MSAIKSLKTYRAWVNQPSLHQPDHDLHGKHAIVVNDDGISKFLRLSLMSPLFS